MGRSPRLPSRTGCFHVVARGNNQQNVFLEEGDFLAYRDLLCEYGTKYLVAMHHYCLMSNHVHLVLKAADFQGVSRFMHDVQRSYVLFRWRKERFSGHLWQGRFRSFSIEEESYLLECGRYVERNPVRAGIVRDPGDYPWSSYAAYAFGKKDLVVTVSPLYAGMGKTPEERQMCYRTYVRVTRPSEAPGTKSPYGTRYRRGARYLVPG